MTGLRSAAHPTPQGGGGMKLFTFFTFYKNQYTPLKTHTALGLYCSSTTSFNERNFFWQKTWLKPFLVKTGAERRSENFDYRVSVLGRMRFSAPENFWAVGGTKK